MPPDRRSAPAIRRPAVARRLSRAARWTTLVCLVLATGARLAAADSIPYAPALARCYDAILDARFADADAEIAKACGPAPPETCALMRANALWWQIQLNPNDRSKDQAFESQIDRVIDQVARWTTREPNRADAWFFLGAAYGLRVQFRVLRTERFAAARDGKRIKDALERALSLDPTLQDAYFGIGLYHYYAGIAPSVLKILSWLLGLPGGNREQGMQEMWRARNRGALLRGEADYQLQLIDLWYEHKPDEALTLLEGLRAAYPHNPLFLQSIADLQAVYRHDHAASLETWRTLYAAARDRRVALPEMSEVRARLGMAVELDALDDTDAAIDQLKAVVAAKPSAPYGATALAWLRLGAAYDRLGFRDRALEAYRAAIAAAPSGDPDHVAAQARDAMRRQPDARRAEAYRLSIEGVRALAAFERVIAWRPAPPPTALAASSLEAARLLEAAGPRDRAIEMYQRASRLRGTDTETRQAAEKALARLRAPRGPR